jgi:hypothetical protein
LTLGCAAERRADAVGVADTGCDAGSRGVAAPAAPRPRMKVMRVVMAAIGGRHASRVSYRPTKTNAAPTKPLGGR